MHHQRPRCRWCISNSDLDSSLTRSWSDPARDLFQPLLDWADPDVVYVTWGKIWLPVFLAFTLCAFVVRRRRQPVGYEKWAWRIALTGYVGACASVAAEYWSQWTSVDQGVVDAVFVVTAPFLLLTMVGSTLLGIALLRRGMRPALPAWLLTLAIPSLIVISEVTSLGNVALPVMFAFGILGRRIAAEDAQSFSPIVAART